jgi:hypothetical protein
MYGEQNAIPARDERPPIEPVSAVHENTISILQDANKCLNVLLSKVRGSQPESGKAGLEKVPERNLLADSRALRELATQVFDKARELHDYIGHEKS